MDAKGPRLHDPLLLFEQDMPTGQQHCIAGGFATIFSVRNPETETANEDAAALIPVDADSAVFVVADGMGGLAAGEQAARLAIRAMKAEIARGASDGLLIRAALMNGIERANMAVQELGPGTGTTLAAVELSGNTMRPYHVGDSFILVSGQRGKVKLATVSHSPVGYAVAAGVLGEQEAMHHEERHLVSNFVGTPEMHIEVGPTLKMAPRDTLLLASDGLSDNLHRDEIIQRIRKGPLNQVAKSLSRDVRARMCQPERNQPSKPDDLTFIVFRRCVAKRERPKIERVAS